MKSVVDAVYVRWEADRAAIEAPWFRPPFGISQDAAYACAYVEKYPGDFRWRCGVCGQGEVRPVVGAFCDKCAAFVTNVGRDEDEKMQAWRRDQEEFKRAASMGRNTVEGTFSIAFPALESPLERAIREVELARIRLELKPKFILKDITGYDPRGDSATIEKPQKQALKVLPETKKRKIEL